MKQLRAAGAAVAAWAALMGAEARAEFPEKDITWIVPFAPGGGYDAWSRQLAASMQKQLPQGISVIVKNITGAGGRTGTIALYRARPDGYTVGLLDVAGLQPYQMAVGADKAAYDMGKFTWVGRVANEPWVLLASAKSPIKNLDDLKARPALSWGVEGVGSTKWLFSVLQASELKLPLRFVSGYGGTGELIPASLRGDFELWTNPGSAHMPYVKSGDLRALMQFGETRTPALPDVPTAREQGVDFVAEILRLVAAPPGTRPEVVKTLETALLKAMDDPAFKEWVEKSQQEVNPGGQKEAEASIATFTKLIERHMGVIKDDLAKQ